MEDVLDEVVSSEDLKKFERVYHEQLHASDVTHKAQFEYAWCLVRSKYPADIRKGIVLLEDLYSNDSASGKRDCLYYLAIGNARIREYTKALSYVRAFLQIEPANEQVQQLERLIKKRMEKGFLFITSNRLRKIRIVADSSLTLLQPIFIILPHSYYLMFLLIFFTFLWLARMYVTLL